MQDEDKKPVKSNDYFKAIILILIFIVVGLVAYYVFVFQPNQKSLSPIERANIQEKQDACIKVYNDKYDQDVYNSSHNPLRFNSNEELKSFQIPRDIGISQCKTKYPTI